MKAWLKGGLIGVSIGLLGLIGLLLAGIWKWFGILHLLNFPIYYFISVLQYGRVISIQYLFHGGQNIQMIMIYGNFIAPIIYFVIGSLIGLLIQKIKSKK